MNLYYKKNGSPAKNIFVSLAAVTAVIIVLNIFAPAVKNLFYKASSPVSGYFLTSGQNFSSLLRTIFYGGKLKRENDGLKKENEMLMAQVAILKDYEKEREDFKEALRNTSRDNFVIVFSRIVGIDVGGDFLLIDKGSKDGISKNMPVISSEKVLFGRISDVYGDFSKVMLISGENNVVSVKVDYMEPASESNGFVVEAEENYDLESVPQDIVDGNRGRPDLPRDIVYGAIRGSGNLSLYLDLVPVEAELKEDGILTTSALDGIFPKNLLVGKITSVFRNDLKPFQTAQVQPFFDLSRASNLMVITNYLIK